MKLQNSNIKFQVQIKIFKIKMLIFRLNEIFWIEILIFTFENNNLEFKYQVLNYFFLNLDNNFHNWNVNFQIQIRIFKIEMSIFIFKLQYSKLKCPFLESINIFGLVLKIQNNNLELKFQVQIVILRSIIWTIYIYKILVHTFKYTHMSV